MSGAADDVAESDVLADLAGLVDFARAGRVPGGFAWLDLDGRPDPTRPVELWITCRTTHVAALATMLGVADAADLVDHGLAALGVSSPSGPAGPAGLCETGLHDTTYGGWSAATGDGAKEAYGHAFVVLAAASATAAGRPGARELLEESLRVVEERFWVEADSMPVDRWDPTFSVAEDYRGVNATMHLVEALLAAHDVLGPHDAPVLLERTARMTGIVLQRFGREHGYRLPEHYDVSWTARPELNRERPEDRFRPYGVTVGHLYEWARLAVHVRRAGGTGPDGDLLHDARALFARATTDGWAVDGAPGFVYTTDFDGRPVVRERLHWVAAEALGAAWVLAQETGEEQYAGWHRTWADYVEEHVVDRVGGSWWHELDPANRPASRLWPGKPDVYHAFGALLLPLLPPCSSVVGGVLARRGQPPR